MFAQKRRLWVDSGRSARPIATNFWRTGLGALLALALALGCDGEQRPQSVVPAAPATGNKLLIHLQEGFTRGSEIAITIDGREVYRGTPKTNELTGFAAQVQATPASTRPVVGLSVPAEGIGWSQKIDLSAGQFLGISLDPRQQVCTRQVTTGFGYD